MEIDRMYRELAEKLAEREREQWIPCSERLPMPLTEEYIKRCEMEVVYNPELLE